MLEFVPEDSRRILDVGCGEGLFSEEIKRKLRAEVWGIEYDSNAAEKAKCKVDKVLHGDLNALIDNLPEKYFDCIVLNDVLEHLVDPYTVLARLKVKLVENGVIVASIPNVWHISVLKELFLHKQWKYTDAGILDRTHLRFFTKKSILEMFDATGFDVIRIKGINKTSSFRKFHLWNILCLGYLSDAKYAQYACVARPRK
jgi:2-polyprenyl-3-methyl-5-hydroxy-6-metoxy-1,4-benzoquinol methylase